METCAHLEIAVLFLAPLGELTLILGVYTGCDNTKLAKRLINLYEESIFLRF